MANWKITTGYSILYEFQAGLPIYNNGIFTIPSATNEQTPPANVFYVAKWGNDVTGNGSRDRPFLTIAKGTANSTTNRLVVIGTGVYRESCSVFNSGSMSNIFVADGNVTIEGTGINNFLSNAQGGYIFDGFKITNFLNIGNSAAQYALKFTNCVISNILGTVENRSLLSRNNIYVNINRLFDTTANGMTVSAFSRYFVNNAFINIKNLQILQGTIVPFGLIYNIYKNCNIQFQVATGSDYNIYHNCNFRFNATAGTQPIGLPEDSGNTYVPSGWMATRPTTVAAIQAGQVAAGFGGVGFANSMVTDPLFNNVALGDFTLQPTSPARNLAYEGTFVGAKSVGTVLKFRLIEANGAWQNSAATNLTIIDDSATLTTDATALIESNVINWGSEKVARFLNVLGLSGDRNGEWVDSSTDLAASSTASGSNLLSTANVPFVVELGTITYNSILYTVGQKFTTVSGVTDYTPTGGGVVRQIIEAPNRLCYEMRISNVSSADVASQTYWKYEIGTQPTVNRVGNIPTGAINRGNGNQSYDTNGAFDRTAANVFPLSFKWFQIRLTVQNNNLT